MWSSSITCVVARLLCVCVCLWKGVACMGEYVCLFTYVEPRKEREGGRARERQRKTERFVRHLYLQTTGWVPTRGREIRLKDLCVRSVYPQVCMSLGETRRETADRQREEPVQLILAATFQPVYTRFLPKYGSFSLSRVWFFFPLPSSHHRFMPSNFWPRFGWVFELILFSFPASLTKHLTH